MLRCTSSEDDAYAVHDVFIRSSRPCFEVVFGTNASQPAQVTSQFRINLHLTRNAQVVECPRCCWIFPISMHCICLSQTLQMCLVVHLTGICHQWKGFRPDSVFVVAQLNAHTGGLDLAYTVLARQCLIVAVIIAGCCGAVLDSFTLLPHVPVHTQKTVSTTTIERPCQLHGWWETRCTQRTLTETRCRHLVRIGGTVCEAPHELEQTTGVCISHAERCSVPANRQPTAWTHSSADSLRPSPTCLCPCAHESEETRLWAACERRLRSTPTLDLHPRFGRREVDPWDVFRRQGWLVQVLRSRQRRWQRAQRRGRGSGPAHA